MCTRTPGRPSVSPRASSSSSAWRSACCSIAADPGVPLGSATAARAPASWTGADESGSDRQWIRKQMGHLHADSAVADEAGGAIEYRFPAGPKILMGAIWLDPAEGEIEERTPGLDVRFEFGAFRFVPAGALKYSCLVQRRAHLYSEHIENRAGYFGDALAFV